MSMPAPTVPRSAYTQVIVASGHMVDAPDRPATRFPADAEGNVAAAVRTAMAEWNVDGDTLVISGGARGADIIVAEAGLDLGATVWLLLALPDDEFVERSVRLPGTDWEGRFLALRSRCPTWIQGDVIGPPPNGSDPSAVFSRNNAWCLESGLAQGPPDGVHAVVVWDGGPGDGDGGTGDFVARARELGIGVMVITPSPG